MPAFLLNPHRTWLLLVLATATTFWVRADGMVGFAAGMATLGIAWLKGRLVVLDFMELRTAPRLWRGIIEGWLMLVTTLIFAVYWFGSAILGDA